MATNISAEEIKSEFLKCKADPAYFISNYVFVVHPVKGRVPFLLYKFQQRIIKEIISNRFTLIRKFRQAGVTTIMCAYALWYITFNKDKQIMVVSIGDRESTSFLKRVVDMYSNLPPWLQAEVVEKNAHNLTLKTGSRVRSQPAGAGRSEAVSLLIVDEAAFIEGMEEFWKAIFPTISTGGRAILLSTVNGTANTYYRLYKEATQRKNQFHIIDIHWKEHPEYNNPQWEKVMRENLGPRGWRQEVECVTGDTEITIKNKETGEILKIQIQKVFDLL